MAVLEGVWAVGVSQPRARETTAAWHLFLLREAGATRLAQKERTQHRTS